MYGYCEHYYDKHIKIYEIKHIKYRNDICEITMYENKYNFGMKYSKLFTEDGKLIYQWDCGDYAIFSPKIIPEILRVCDEQYHPHLGLLKTFFEKKKKKRKKHQGYYEEYRTSEIYEIIRVRYMNYMCRIYAYDKYDKHEFYYPIHYSSLFVSNKELLYSYQSYNRAISKNIISKALRFCDKKSRPHLLNLRNLL